MLYMFWRRALLLSAVFVLSGAAAVAAEPGDATTALRDKTATGSGTLRFLGIPIYDATLFSSSGADLRRFEAHPLALELTYRRALKGSAIAERSLKEMADQGPIDPARATRWLAQMTAAFPDVNPGDRLLGTHHPVSGARFYFNGRLKASIDDVEFSRRFFAIWLSPQTSQPALRDSLLSGPRPVIGAR